MPVTIMVLPAPVSPVTTVNPGSSAMVASLITPRSVIRSSSITDGVRSGGRRVGSSRGPGPLRRQAGALLGLGGTTPPLDAQSELVDQPVSEGRLAEPGEA